MREGEEHKMHIWTCRTWRIKKSTIPRCLQKHLAFLLHPHLQLLALSLQHFLPACDQLSREKPHPPGCPICIVNPPQKQQSQSTHQLQQMSQLSQKSPLSFVSNWKISLCPQKCTQRENKYKMQQRKIKLQQKGYRSIPFCWNSMSVFTKPATSAWGSAWSHSSLVISWGIALKTLSNNFSFTKMAADTPLCPSKIC